MKQFIKGFVYAFRGLKFCVKEERNFRFHLAVAFHLFVYMPFFDLTRAEICVIITLCGLVISLEAANSAVERAVDCTERISAVAGASKDIAAGAVLVAAVTSVLCGVILLWQPAAFIGIIRFFIRHPSAIAVQTASAAFWIWFVFRPGLMKNKSK